MCRISIAIIIIYCWYLTTGSSFKTLAFTFIMGASTIGKVVAETAIVLWDELQPLHMQRPTKYIFNDIANDFYHIWKFSNVIGAIDENMFGYNILNI